MEPSVGYHFRCRQIPTVLTLVAREKMFEAKKGGSRHAIWYKIHPIAQISAFSSYSVPLTTSGLQQQQETSN